MLRRPTLLLPFVLIACATAPRVLHEDPALERVIADLRPYITRQLVEMGIPGACIAVLDVDPASGARRLWVEGFGQPVNSAAGALPASLDPVGMPASAVHRVASISKLFADTAAMVLVERGLLDLDAPVSRYLPDFQPHNPFDGEVTLRHLMGHRAGIVRESPVGHYFDPTEPTLQATVASLNETSLVHAPGSRYKYSNPGIGVVGAVVAAVTGQSFEAAVDALVLEPLGLTDSDFRARPDLVARQAEGVMWTYDGRAVPTPGFAFGYGPAANLRSTVLDLVTFAASWLPGSEPRVLRPETQERMWKLPAGNKRGCGLGFFVNELEGVRTVGHGGAVYGFASMLAAMPDEGIAVAVVCTKDFGNAVADAIADRAMLAVLGNRRGEALEPPVYPQPVGVERARKLAGTWLCGEHWVELKERDGELYYDPNIGVRTRLRALPDGSLISDDPLSMGSRKLRELPDGRLHDGMVPYERDSEVPAPCPEELRPYLGEYGWDHNVLVVYEDHGKLGVLIEWVVRDLLDRVGEDRYLFPGGMYRGDVLRFERDDRGEVVAAIVGGARFPRRPGPTAGTFRIDPVRPIPELIEQARAAAGPPDPRPRRLRDFDLLDLRALGDTLKLDVRYATANNFLGHAIYPAAIAKLQRPAAGALRRVQESLAQLGLGLVVFDAYRPWWVTKVFYDATPESMKHFVANPNNGSRHNRGCAIDLSLYDLATGEVIEMPSGYDEFTARAYPDYPGGTSRQRFYRELLRRAMEAQGFAVYEYEWWHFDFHEWRQYPLGNEVLQ
ncbi:MAG: serine hydrolase [bacterium]|nr:serine hydrolase [bacterium]